MCHKFIQDPIFFQLLFQIDAELAAETHNSLCSCGGSFHRGNYSRKPRGLPFLALPDFEFRFSFCCSQCRKRNTPMSLRFMGRRVYLSLIVVLMSRQKLNPSLKENDLCVLLRVPIRTIRRWQTWWVQSFPSTTLWQARCALFMPPVMISLLPDSLMARFMGLEATVMLRLLHFLAPLT